MVFAEMDYQKEYRDFHAELIAFVNRHFSQVDSGMQGDSWIWIFDNDEKVRLDTFSSMKHQIKSQKNGWLVRRVIETLLLSYNVNVYEEPELEGNEVI